MHNKEVHTVLLHDTQEPDHNPGRWTDENLTLVATLSVHNAHKGIVLYMLLAPYHLSFIHTRTEILTILKLKGARRRWSGSLACEFALGWNRAFL